MNIRPRFAANRFIAAIAAFLSAFLFAVTFHSHAFFQQQLGSNPSNSGQNTAQQLELGKPIERELAGRQSHTYQLRVSANQYVRLTVKQRAIDLKLRFYAPDNKLLIEWDRQPAGEGMEELAWVVEAEGNYRLEVVSAVSGAKAEAYEIKWVELRAANEKERKQTQAHRLGQEATDLLDKEKPEEAIPKAREAVQIMESLWGLEHVEVGEVLILLGLSYDAKGDYAAAEPLYLRTLAIREKYLGLEHPYVAGSLSILANLYYSQGNYEHARPLHQRGLAIKEKIQGLESLGVAASLNDLAVLDLRKGDYKQARSEFQRALSIFEKTLGPEHPHVASTLDNLAIIFSDEGDYGKAEPLIQRALAIREKVLGPEHHHVTHSLNNLACLYGNKGDYKRAEILFLRALTIKEKVLGREHPSTALTLHSLAEIYVNTGDYTQAEMLLQRVLSITEKSLGTEHADMALVLRDLAMLYFQRGKEEMALSLLQRALAISEQALGLEHADVAVALSNLGTISHSQGDYTKAKMFHQRSLAIREKSLGLEHPDVATSLNNLADLYLASGNMPEAVSFRMRAAKVSERNIGLNLLTGSDRQKQAYLTMLTSETNRIVSLHARSVPADFTSRELALTTILQRKGRALDAMTGILAAGRANPQDKPLFDQLKDTASQLAWLVLSGPQRITPTEHLQRIKALEEQKENLEANLGSRSAEFRQQLEPITLAAVKAKIPNNAALVEFFAYRPFNAKSPKTDAAFSPPHYVAYVLRQQGEVQWVELGEVKAIDEAVSKLRQALRCKHDMAGVRQLARALDTRVMQPVRARLGQAQHIIVSPDGALNLVPFAALVDEKDKYLIETFELSYLTSGRDLLRLQVTRESKNPPLIIANPDFGLMKGEALAKRSPAPRCEQAKQVDGEQKDFQKVSLLALPWTIQEAGDLKKLLPQAKLLMGPQATETALKLAGAPRLLHIATHGFFLQDSEPVVKGGRGFDFTNFSDLRSASWAAKIENPLLRSGLALANFNEHRKSDGGDDGVLTAMEAANLDLWGTKLVILSACDTGLGEIKNGEGVYGLRRALVLAGAETQVMSLWPVPDRETRILMKGYYQRLLDKDKKEGRGEALRKVQLEMLKTPDYQHPFYWASFIQIGEWANLDGNR